VIISIFPNGNFDYEVHIVSDKIEAISGNLIVAVETFNGTMLFFDAVTNFDVDEGSSSVAYTITNETLKDIDVY